MSQTLRTCLKWHFFLLLCTLSLPSQAQVYRMVRFGVTEGLPSSEVYCTLQDRAGYMWFGTDRGAVRYDGYRFQVFTTEQGLPDNTVFKLFEDHRGRIWFGSYSSLLTWYKDGEIVPYVFNTVLKEKGFTASAVTDMAVGQDGSVYLGTVLSGLLGLDSAGNLRVEGFRGKGHCFFRAGNYLVSGMAGKAKMKTQNPEVDFPEGTNFLLEPTAGQYLFDYESRSQLLSTAEAAKGPDGLLALGLGERLILYQNGRKVRELTLEGIPVRLYFDRSDRLWVGLFSGGVSVFDRQGNRLPIRLPQLSNYTVSDILQDREGSYWFTTTQQGVFFLSSLDFRYLPFATESTNPVSELVSINDSLAYFSRDNDGLFSISTPDFQEWKMKRFSEGYKGMTKLIWDANQGKLWAANQKLHYLRNDQVEMVPNVLFTQGVKSSVMRRDGEIWLGGRKGLFRFDGERNEFLDKYGSGLVIWALFEDAQGQLWLGTHKGLYKYPEVEPAFDPVEYPELSNRISAIDQLPDGRLVVGTLGAGIVLVDKDSLLVIREKDGLGSNLVNCLSVDREGVIWAGSGRGLHRIDPYAVGRPSIRNFGLGAGMPFLEVQSVAAGPGKIWLAGPEGISVMNRKRDEKTSAQALIHLRSVQVNARDTAIFEGLQLDHRHNDLRFAYIGLRFQGEGQLTYRYRMEGLDKEWRYTRDTVVSYPGLASGNYAFVVAAGSPEDGWSETPARVELEIAPAFWQRWWFLPMVLVVILLMAALVAWYFLRQWQQRMRRQRNLEQWKMKALRARMDPHFTFNSLNTIQAYITTHDTLAAEKYLNKFSRLVRLVLHQSDSETISLAEEMEMLTIYLELEQMRFGGRFEFEIKVDPSLDRETTGFPGMMVQPLAENAIKHGLLPRPGGGRIQISFVREKEQIRCSVRDNGIGREAARTLREGRTDNHRSAGLDLVRSRLQLLSNATGDPITIDDLKDAQGQAVGTKFSFLIPITLIH